MNTKDFYNDSYSMLFKLVKEYNNMCITCNFNAYSYLSEVLRWERLYIVDLHYPKNIVLPIVNDALHKICEEQDCIDMWEIYNTYSKANKDEYKDYL